MNTRRQCYIHSSFISLVALISIMILSWAGLRYNPALWSEVTFVVL